MSESMGEHYLTFQQIMGELLNPIDSKGLEPTLLKNLYESKLVYLEELKTQCFKDMNRASGACFSMQDYRVILLAMADTRLQLRKVILHALHQSLELV